MPPGQQPRFHNPALVIESYLREKGAPWWFGDPTQLVYLVYREDTAFCTVAQELDLHQK